VSGRIGEDPSGIPNNLLPYITQVYLETLSRERKEKLECKCKCEKINQINDFPSLLLLKIKFIILFFLFFFYCRINGAVRTK
jgi:hypothetical protein